MRKAFTISYVTHDSVINHQERSNDPHHHRF
jgi:hypothetical protein